MLLYPLQPDLIDHIAKGLQRVAEEWIGGQKLQFNNVHGIRRYLKGGRCGLHTDTYSKLV